MPYVVTMPAAMGVFGTPPREVLIWWIRPSLIYFPSFCAAVHSIPTIPTDGCASLGELEQGCQGTSHVRQRHTNRELASTRWHGRLGAMNHGTGDARMRDIGE